MKRISNAKVVHRHNSRQLFVERQLVLRLIIFQREICKIFNSIHPIWFTPSSYSLANDVFLFRDFEYRERMCHDLVEIYKIIAVFLHWQRRNRWKSKSHLWRRNTARLTNFDFLSSSRGGPRVPLQCEKIIPESSLRNERKRGDGEEQRSLEVRKMMRHLAPGRIFRCRAEGEE